MIYVNYKKEKFWIDVDGKTYAVLSHAENMAHAVITDFSSFKYKDDDNFRYFSKAKAPNGYFLENEVINKNSRSLLEALGLQEGKIVGLYFSNRVLLFSLVNGSIKSRFSPETIFSPQDVIYPFTDWGLPENAPVEVYGIHKSFQDLAKRIANTPALKDREEIKRKFNLYQKIFAAVLVLISIISYAGVNYWYSYEKKQHSRLNQTTTNLKNQLSNEIKKRLPEYVNCMNIPLDKVFYSLKFLEPFNFNSVELDVNGNNITLKATVLDITQAYAIKELAKKNNANFELNLQQGGEDVQIIITKAINIKEKDSYIGNPEFCNKLSDYNIIYSSNL